MSSGTPATSAVVVAVRVRPLSRKEIAAGQQAVITSDGNTLSAVDPTALFAMESLRSGALGGVRGGSGGAEKAAAAFDRSAWSRHFTFDHVFDSMDPKSQRFDDQNAVFEAVGTRVLESAWDGYNASLLAYGQTGAGKSYSMMGTGSVLDPAKVEARHFGLIPRISFALFQSIQEANRAEAEQQQQQQQQQQARCRYTVEVSYMEIYNETVYDLFSLGAPAASAVAPSASGVRNIGISNSGGGGLGGKLRVREHPVHGVYVQDLTVVSVENYLEVGELMALGGRARTVAHTNMNEFSSRSHAIFSITFRQTISASAGGRQEEKASKIHMVDLAGSERVDQTGASGERLREAKNINRSLATLCDVVKALASSAAQAAAASNATSNATRQHQQHPFSELSGLNSATATANTRGGGGGGQQPPPPQQHIPYRNSVLTWLLKESLGGNSRTTMLAAVSPAASHFDETISTLKYAERAKKMKTRAVVNARSSEESIIRELRDEVARLRKELEARQQNNNRKDKNRFGGGGEGRSSDDDAGKDDEGGYGAGYGNGRQQQQQQHFSQQSRGNGNGNTPYSNYIGGEYADEKDQVNYREGGIDNQYGDSAMWDGGGGGGRGNLRQQQQQQQQHLQPIEEEQGRRSRVNNNNVTQQQQQRGQALVSEGGGGGVAGRGSGGSGANSANKNKGGSGGGRGSSKANKQKIRHGIASPAAATAANLALSPIHEELDNDAENVNGGGGGGGSGSVVNGGSKEEIERIHRRTPLSFDSVAADELSSLSSTSSSLSPPPLTSSLHSGGDGGGGVGGDGGGGSGVFLSTTALETQLARLEHSLAAVSSSSVTANLPGQQHQQQQQQQQQQQVGSVAVASSAQAAAATTPSLSPPPQPRRQFNASSLEGMMQAAPIHPKALLSSSSSFLPSPSHPHPSANVVYGRDMGGGAGGGCGCGSCGGGSAFVSANLPVEASVSDADADAPSRHKRSPGDEDGDRKAEEVAEGGTGSSSSSSSSSSLMFVRPPPKLPRSRTPPPLLRQSNSPPLPAPPPQLLTPQATQAETETQAETQAETAAATAPTLLQSSFEPLASSSPPPFSSSAAASASAAATVKAVAVKAVKAASSNRAISGSAGGGGQQAQVALRLPGDAIDFPTRPRLVNLNQDPLFSECLVYYANDGVTLIGSDPASSDIQLSGPDIRPRHAVLTYSRASLAEGDHGGLIHLCPVDGAVAYLNGVLVSGHQSHQHESLPPSEPGSAGARSSGSQSRYGGSASRTRPVLLSHNARVVFGKHHVFRFEQPLAAKRGLPEDLDQRRADALADRRQQGEEGTTGATAAAAAAALTLSSPHSPASSPHSPSHSPPSPAVVLDAVLDWDFALRELLYASPDAPIGGGGGMGTGYNGGNGDPHGHNQQLRRSSSSSPFFFQHQQQHHHRASSSSLSRDSGSAGDRSFASSISNSSLYLSGVGGGTGGGLGDDDEEGFEGRGRNGQGGAEDFDAGNTAVTTMTEGLLLSSGKKNASASSSSASQKLVALELKVTQLQQERAEFLQKQQQQLDLDGDIDSQGGSEIIDGSSNSSSSDSSSSSIDGIDDVDDVDGNDVDGNASASLLGLAAAGLSQELSTAALGEEGLTASSFAEESVEEDGDLHNALPPPVPPFPSPLPALVSSLLVPKNSLAHATTPTSTLTLMGPNSETRVVEAAAAAAAAEAVAEALPTAAGAATLAPGTPPTSPARPTTTNAAAAWSPSASTPGGAGNSGRDDDDDDDESASYSVASEPSSPVGASIVSTADAPADTPGASDDALASATAAANHHHHHHRSTAKNNHFTTTTPIRGWCNSAAVAAVAAATTGTSLYASPLSPDSSVVHYSGDDFDDDSDQALPPTQPSWSSTSSSSREVEAELAKRKMEQKSNEVASLQVRMQLLLQSATATTIVTPLAGSSAGPTPAAAATPPSAAAFSFSSSTGASGFSVVHPSAPLLPSSPPPPSPGGSALPSSAHSNSHHHSAATNARTTTPGVLDGGGGALLDASGGSDEMWDVS